MNKFIQRSVYFVKRNSPTILTCIGAAGVVATGVMSVRATPRAIELLEQAEEEKGEKLTAFEVVKTAGPVYIPSLLIGASTIACIFGANVLNTRKQAALTSAYALLNQSYKEYKDKVVELYGIDANKAVLEGITKDHYKGTDISLSEDGENEKELFFDFYSLNYFEATMEDVIKAEYNLNRNLTTFGFASLGEFYDELGIPTSSHTHSIGWSMEAGAIFYGYSWVDFEHEKVELDDGLECWCLSMVHDPIDIS